MAADPLNAFNSLAEIRGWSSAPCRSWRLSILLLRFRWAWGRRAAPRSRAFNSLAEILSATATALRRASLATFNSLAEILVVSFRGCGEGGGSLSILLLRFRREGVAVQHGCHSFNSLAEIPWRRTWTRAEPFFSSFNSLAEIHVLEEIIPSNFKFFQFSC